MAQEGRQRRQRRSFTDEFRAGAVRLVLVEGKTIPQVARDLDLTESALRTWVERARADAGKGKPGALTTAEREELAALRKKVRQLEMEREIPQSRGLLREREQLKFAFIHAEKASFPITLMCTTLQVSRAGYYAWVDRPPSARAVDDQQLAVRVREIHELTKKRYGAPRVQRELAKAQDIHVSQKRIARLMRQAGLRARPKRRFKCTTMSNHDQPVAANLLDRKFEATAPNQKWVGDTTELLTGNGKLFLAVILDLYSKFVVGWALSPVNDRHLTIAALEMAIRRRCPEVGLLHHSDQGCTYASEDYQKILADRGIVCSMSRRGNPYDNAVMEAWNSTFKIECGERFLNNEVARNEAFDFIEVFYNQKRLHSAIGYVSPAEFEWSRPMERVA